MRPPLMVWLCNRLRLQDMLRAVAPFKWPSLLRKDAAVNRLATSITQLTLCQVTTSEIDAATKLLDKACQKLQGIQSVPFIEGH